MAACTSMVFDPGPGIIRRFESIDQSHEVTRAFFPPAVSAFLCGEVFRGLLASSTRQSSISRQNLRTPHARVRCQGNMYRRSTRERYFKATCEDTLRESGMRAPNSLADSLYKDNPRAPCL